MSTIAVTAPRRVLADSVPRTLLSETALVVGAACAMGLLAQVTIHLSFSPVPITGQTFGVMLAGTALGWRRFRRPGQRAAPAVERRAQPAPRIPLP